MTIKGKVAMKMFFKVVLLLVVIQFLLMLSACREGATSSVRPAVFAGS